MLPGPDRERLAPPGISPARRAFFWLVLAAGLFAFWEVASFLAFYAIDRDGFSYARLDAERRLFATGEVTDPGVVARRQQRPLEQVLHPFMGFTREPRPATAYWLARYRYPLNAFGFLGPEPIRTRTPDNVIVGITGGSVAGWLSVLGEDELRARLAEVPRFRDKQIEIVRLVQGGFKQPQQLMAVTYFLGLGAEFDYLVNLDGLNELVYAVQNERRGVNPSFPRGWEKIAAQGLDRDHQALVGRVVFLRDRRRELAAYAPGSPARWSVTLQLAWRVRDRLLEGELHRATVALDGHVPDELGYAIRGPAVDETLPGADATARAVRLWANASRQLHRLARTNDIAYLHFLQPNQYVPGAKPIGPEERTVAIRDQSHFARVVPEGYPALARAGDELRRGGVDFHDLTGLLGEVSEPVYIDDCCHLNELGNRLLARAIAAAMASAPDPRAKRGPAAELALMSFDDRGRSIAGRQLSLSDSRPWRARSGGDLEPPLLSHRESVPSGRRPVP